MLIKDVTLFSYDLDLRWIILILRMFSGSLYDLFIIISIIWL